MFSFIRKFWRAFLYALARQFQSKEAQIRWHKRQLMRLDTEFLFQQAGIELVRRRQVFYDQGGSPTGSKCPDLYDVLDDLGHKSKVFAGGSHLTSN
ncbi:MAG TPA: hypothetical protein VF803_03015 [Candidatus Paceibacterota bacterium]